jgi:hypothetical protein
MQGENALMTALRGLMEGPLIHWGRPSDPGHSHDASEVRMGTLAFVSMCVNGDCSYPTPRPPGMM